MTLTVGELSADETARFRGIFHGDLFRSGGEVLWERQNQRWAKETSTGQVATGTFGELFPEVWGGTAANIRDLRAAKPVTKDGATYVLGGSLPLVNMADPATVPPLPHPDASNLGLGPNLGGADAVAFPWEVPTGGQPGSDGDQGTASPMGGVLLIGGVILLVVLLSRR